jgi:hypothetical protein
MRRSARGPHPEWVALRSATIAIGESVMIHLAIVLALLAPVTAVAQTLAEGSGSWAPLQNPFPSTGGGGWMIDGYRPVVTGSVCTTDFESIAPNGTRHRNTVVFDAVPLNGGRYARMGADGRWRMMGTGWRHFGCCAGWGGAGGALSEDPVNV